MNLQFSEDKNIDLAAFQIWFEQICTTVGYIEVSKEAIKLLLIPFALKGQIREWLETLSPETITSWKEFVQWFLQRIIPMAVMLKTYEELLQFKQNSTEIIGQAWHRFKISLHKAFVGGIDTIIRLQHFYVELDQESKE